MPGEQQVFIGRMLQNTRQAVPLEVTEVAEALHIRRRYIEAIEAGDFDILPGAPYVRGYLVRYGEFLEIDTHALLAEFDKIGHFPGRKFFALSATLDRSPHPGKRLALATLIAAFALVLTWNLATVNPAISPILSFDQFGKPPVQTLGPERCIREETAYPPCYWEDFRLWYRPSKEAVRPPMQMRP